MRVLVLLFSVFVLAMEASALAGETRMPVAGDCAIYREGGKGYIMKAPIYWLRGTIEEIHTRPHRRALCPKFGKPTERFSRDDWMVVAENYPCTADPAQVGEIDVIRVRMRADAWDTPWAMQHGHNGWLYRGHFLNTELKPGVIIDIDGTLLERCDAVP